MIVPLDADMARAVVDEVDEWGRKEMVAAFGPDYRDQAVQGLLDAHQQWAYLRDGTPAAAIADLFCGGIYMPWMIFTPDFPRISPNLTRFVQTTILPKFADSAASRAESLSLTGNVKSHGWLRRMGAKPVEFLPGFGRQGEDVIRWRLTRKDVDFRRFARS